MRYVLWIITAVGLAGCQQLPGSAEYELRQRAEAAVRDHLKDPQSAQFTELSYYVDRDLVCGKVNAKNALGGYTGPKDFAYVNGEALSLDWGKDVNLYLRANHNCLIENINRLRRENPGVKFDDPGPYRPLK